MFIYYYFYDNIYNYGLNANVHTVLSTVKKKKRFTD